MLANARFPSLQAPQPQDYATFQNYTSPNRINVVNQYPVVLPLPKQVHEEYKDLLALMAYKAHLVLLEQLLLLMASL